MKNIEPTIIKLDNDIVLKKWYKDKENTILHREDGPAIVEYQEDKLIREVWFKDNLYHREDGPAAIEYFKSGKIKREVYYKNGKLHRDNDQPAEILYCNNRNNIIKLVWYKDGKKHRINNPAIISYDSNCNSITFKYMINGLVHRKNKPAVIEYGIENYSVDEIIKNYNLVKNCKIYSEKWYINGIPHRDGDQPAEIKYRPFNNTYFEKCWYKNGKMDRDNLPAKIEYDSNGKAIYCMYVSNGEIHRTNGPAVIEFEKNGYDEYEIRYLKYCVNGKIHRDNNKPAIYNKRYSINPTIEYFKNGLHSRLNGPAYTSCAGSELYYILGVRFTKKQYYNFIKKIDNEKLINNINKYSRENLILLKELALFKNKKEIVQKIDNKLLLLKLSGEL